MKGYKLASFFIALKAYVKGAFLKGTNYEKN